MEGSLQRRVRVAAAAVCALGVAALGGALIVDHATATQSAVPAGAVPGVLQTPGSGACVGQAQARGVWRDVDARLDALVLHPSVAGVDAVAQGTAAVQLRAYVQQHLLDQHLTEREQSRLDSLTVVQGARGAQPLTVRAVVTLVRDDYLGAGGHVDHADPGVGQTGAVLASYVRTASGWKLVTLAHLPLPTGSGTSV